MEPYLTGALIACSLVLAVLAATAYFAGLLTKTRPPLRKPIAGASAVVIHNGRILEHNMAKLQYNMDSLLSQLRDKNVSNIEDVEFALLEGNGGLSVLLKSRRQPAAPTELDSPAADKGISSEIIVDGLVVYQNLKKNRLDEQWLIAELKKRGYNSPRDIVFASLTAEGQLHIDDKNGRPEHMYD